MGLTELARLLRQYADTEHGKRSRLHSEIVQGIFADPGGLSDHISTVVEKLSKHLTANEPPDKRDEMQVALKNCI